MKPLEKVAIGISLIFSIFAIGALDLLWLQERKLEGRFSDLSKQAYSSPDQAGAARDELSYLAVHAKACREVMAVNIKREVGYVFPIAKLAPVTIDGIACGKNGADYLFAHNYEFHREKLDFLQEMVGNE